MKRTRTATLLVCVVCALGNIGCMRGVTYKMPMPQSMTLGTVKVEEATLASAQTNQHLRTIAQAESENK